MEQIKHDEYDAYRETEIKRERNHLIVILHFLYRDGSLRTRPTSAQPERRLRAGDRRPVRVQRHRRKDICDAVPWWP